MKFNTHRRDAEGTEKEFETKNLYVLCASVVNARSFLFGLRCSRAVPVLVNMAVKKIAVYS